MAGKISWKTICWLIVILIIGGFLFNVFRSNLTIEDLPITYAFQGNSDDLKNTHIVPTLDTPSSADKNIVWCGSFALAWRQLKDQVIKEPIQLANAKPIADRLNNCPFGPSDLTDDCWFAAAGWVKDGIVDSILQGMNQKFPDVTPNLQIDPEDVIIAYSYLQAAVNFEIPFLPYKKGITFHDSNDNQTQVKAFGIWEYDPIQLKIKEQVEVLYDSRFEPKTAQRMIQEYVLDLSKNTQPYQIILASVPFQGNLDNTVNYINDKIKRNLPKDDYFRSISTGTLIVPDMTWKISHRFKQLEGKGKFLLNKGFEGLNISKAIQQIDFTLNRKGAKLKSSSEVAVACEPREFIFDHPFLLLMQKRGSDQPILALWIADTELLVKQSP